jgi:predicted RNA polymerase sigma factor
LLRRLDRVAEAAKADARAVALPLNDPQRSLLGR